MGHVKRALDVGERRLDERFSLDTAEGVQALLIAWYEVGEEALRGNYSACDVLIDVNDALDDAPLSEREREVADLVRRWDIAEVAGIVGIEESSARTFLMRAATKISEYMRGGEEA